MAEEEKKEKKEGEEKEESLAEKSSEDEIGKLAATSDDWFFSPFKEIDSVFEDLDRTLNRFLGRPYGVRRRRTLPSLRSPMTDLRDLGDLYRVEAEVPGLDKSDIEIELRDDNIVINGERTEEKEEEGEDYLRRERGYKSFYRRLPMPNEVKSDEIKASLENGILTIDLPKKESKKKKGKRIKIE